MDSLIQRLPEELVACVFHHLHAEHALAASMVVNRQWYIYGARNLHAHLVLRLPHTLTNHSPAVVISLMRRLVSPTLSTAHLIRHLVVAGHADKDVWTLIVDILRHATALRSLDVHDLHLPPDSTALFAPDAFSSPDLLPSLVALNASSCASFPPLMSLVHTRRLHALRVHAAMDRRDFRSITDPASLFADSIEFVELAISVDTPGEAVQEVTHLASALSRASLRGLALQFVLARPGLMSWPDFEDVIDQMGPSLQTFSGLDMLSIAIRPDPPMNSPHGSGDAYRESLTRRLAEHVIADHGLSRLMRIELRWHGWKIEGGNLMALSRTELARLPQSWMFKLNGPESQ